MMIVSDLRVRFYVGRIGNFRCRHLGRAGESSLFDLLGDFANDILLKIFVESSKLPWLDTNCVLYLTCM